MRMPTDRELNDLINAVDTACWCWSVQKNSKRKGQVDWKSSLDDLVKAWEVFQLKTSDKEAVLSNDQQ